MNLLEEKLEEQEQTPVAADTDSNRKLSLIQDIGLNWS